MKLIKFIAATALVASTSFVSGANPASVDAANEFAGVCPDWPYCRGVEIAEQAAEQHHIKLDSIRKAV